MKAVCLWEWRYYMKQNKTGHTLQVLGGYPIEDLPVGSCVVVPNYNNTQEWVEYTEALGRVDISIVGQPMIKSSNDTCGVNMNFPVFIDHRCILDGGNIEAIRWLNKRYVRTRCEQNIVNSLSRYKGYGPEWSESLPHYEDEWKSRWVWSEWRAKNLPSS